MKLVFSDKRNGSASATSEGLPVRPRRWSGFATLSVLARAPLVNSTMMLLEVEPGEDSIDANAARTKKFGERITTVFVFSRNGCWSSFAFRVRRRNALFR